MMLTGWYYGAAFLAGISAGFAGYHRVADWIFRLATVAVVIEMFVRGEWLTLVLLAACLLVVFRNNVREVVDVR